MSKRLAVAGHAEVSELEQRQLERETMAGDLLVSARTYLCACGSDNRLVVGVDRAFGWRFLYLHRRELESANDQGLDTIAPQDARNWCIHCGYPRI